MSILVVGNCSIDLTFAVDQFPAPGETLLARERRVDLGGKGANQAVVAHRFGVRTALAAPIGNDAEGDLACARLSREGLDLSLVLRTDAPTDQSILYVTPDGENTIVSSHQAAASATPEWARGAVAATGARDWLVTQGNLALETTCAALAAGRAAGMRTCVNPAPIQYGYDAVFPLCDMVIVNEVEAVALGGSADPLAAGKAIRSGGVPVVLVTLGAAGAVLIDGSGASNFLAPAVAVVDTAGAGDTFCGALVACLDRDLPIAGAVRAAVEAASLSVTRRGTQSSFPDSVEAAAILAGAQQVS
jgi:ribokinase